MPNHINDGIPRNRNQCSLFEAQITWWALEKPTGKSQIDDEKLFHLCGAS